MNKTKLAKNIIMYENVLLNENIIFDIEKAINDNLLEWQNAGVLGELYQNNTIVRNNKVCSVEYHEKQIIKTFRNKDKEILNSISNDISFGFNLCEQDYITDYPIKNYQHEDFSILKYGVGEYFLAHADHHDFFPRKLSMVYYANDEYKGGEIHFINFDIKLKPKRNSLIIFPSTLEYIHEVLPVKVGTKYSISSWLG